ncbi:DUF2628 domain-containing protein [Brenneria sp. g21c3]|uniref:DUF2628 domain-containing protein n=1 Tax=Brenneria sp. g21c3 TaxID=3093893 RepID=UPI002EC34778|nr:DUF2628 domain-containing protein [Brenneria sp. g21c3]
MKTTETGKYSKKWQTRFDFFERYGAPKTKEFRIAIRQEKFFRRLLINMNYYAFFFGCIYFFIIGLWRKNLALIAIIAVFSVIQLMVEEATGSRFPAVFDLIINLLTAMIWGITANYAYYLNEVKGSKSWNPFEGIL